MKYELLLPHSSLKEGWCVKKMITGEFVIYNPSNSAESITLQQTDDERVWISRADGEGGEFKIQEVYNLLDKFYKDNF